MHIPVMLKEVVQILEPEEGKVFVDCTIGAGGHALSLLERGATVLGIDCDREAISFCKKRLSQFKDRVRLFKANFADIRSIVKKSGWRKVDGILYDLGPSRIQIEDPRRGFSFYKNGPLDMRMDTEQNITAAHIIKEMDVQQLYKLIKEFGQERWAKRIAKKIKEKMPSSTLSLAKCVKECVPHSTPGLHPATRTFLALRIFVNKELDALSHSLKNAPFVLKERGKIVVISFHSLEDRIVKSIFKKLSEKGLAKVCKKPIYPSEEEVRKNPSARSAKLRVALLLREVEDGEVL